MADNFLPWLESFQTSSDLINKQNEQFITHINGYLDRLQYIIRAEPRQEVLLELIESSLALMERNFAVEEKLYTNHNYPMVTIHTIEHKNLLNYFRVLKTSLQTGKAIDIKNQIKAVSGLLSSHFTIFDRRATLAISDK